MQTSTVQTPPTTVAASVDAARKFYGRGTTTVRALDGVTAEFPTGAFTAVMGPSGSGKSTLMHCMAGLDTVDEGRIILAGVDLATLSEQDRTILRRERVGFVFQGFNLIPALTADENITLPMSLARQTPDKAWHDELVRILGLGERLDHLPSELSGGQQQRVAVARALVTRPAIVFADEPTGNLDSVSSAAVLSALQRAVRDLAQTVVMVTHDPSAAAYADRVVFLADGRIVHDLADPSADAILDRMKRLDATTTPEG